MMGRGEVVVTVMVVVAVDLDDLREASLFHSFSLHGYFFSFFVLQRDFLFPLTLIYS